MEFPIPEKTTSNIGNDGPKEDITEDHFGTTFHSCPNNIYHQLLETIQTSLTDQQYQYLIIQLKRYCLNDAQWTEFKSKLNSHTNSFTDDQWSQVQYSLFHDRLNDSFSIFTDMIDTSQQKVVLLHAGRGTRKTFVTCKIFEELFMRGEVCHCTCPTGVGASHFPQGHTFHSVFKMWTPDLSASNAIDEIQTALGGNRLKIVVIDEVSMLSKQFLVLLDS